MLPSGPLLQPQATAQPLTLALALIKLAHNHNISCSFSTHIAETSVKSLIILLL